MSKKIQQNGEGTLMIALDPHPLREAGDAYHLNDSAKIERVIKDGWSRKADETEVAEYKAAKKD